ncbi:SDR family NAD(P)-dependent oxidoreductase [Pseudarthrobacter sp. fls2-241-R2A-127]|uniref:SDR family oxidoreductase n=1 Tax=Pseudarthrobacter sp. fls2-241-R2A-127 TaxID=3040303 RepID=UPI0025534161|nr:SDR family NAD(P)-dependent oxidoreductase [Pseudarthrobacter sp. fls2-241-R2A-127]
MQIQAGQVAVITGAASGIGYGLAEALVDRGVSVVLSDVRAEAVHKATEQLTARGALAIAVVTDVTDPDSVDALAARTMEAFGRVDLVCNNAGVVSPAAPTWEQRLDTWRRMIDIKLLGVVHGVRSFAPHLLAQGRGHILNTASSGGLAPLPDRTPYSATMHAVVGVTESLDIELRSTGRGVGATVLCPGLVDTPLGNNSATLGIINRQPSADPNLMKKLAASHGGIITARAAAEAALNAIEADRVHAVPGGGVFERAEARMHALLADAAHDRFSDHASA